MENNVLEYEKRIKILTAIGNENLNKILKEKNKFEVIENDIFYKEGILEFLEENKNIDILILYEKLSGEINIIELIKKIKIINEKINLFFILENKNEEKEKILKKENIKNVFFEDEININLIIEKIEKIKLNDNEKLIEEINYLKNIINKKNEELIKYQKNIINKKIEKKLIIIIGLEDAGKTTILNNLKNIIENKNENEYEFKEIDLKNYLEILKIKNEIYKIIFVIERRIEKIKINKKIINKLILENKINSEKINIIFNKINNYSVNKKISKNIYKKIKIIANIKLNNYPDYLINKKNNYKVENKKLEKCYLKIIRRINV